MEKILNLRPVIGTGRDLLMISFTLFFNIHAFSQAVIPAARHQMVVVSHRGDHTASPENTLQAYERAIADGADYIETDLRTTRDGRLVIMHDATVNRMTDGRGAVKDFTFDSLRVLTVWDHQHPEWGRSKIPSFREVLKTCKGKINIYLDFKEADAAKAWKEIREEGMENSVVVYINHPGQIADWRKTAPQVPLMISLPSPQHDAESMKKFLDSAHIDILDGGYDEYTKQTVEAAATKGIPVWADMQHTGEGAADWDKGLALNLAGMQTDHPGELVQYLVKKGKR